MTTYLTNAFSINMLEDNSSVKFDKIDIDVVRNELYYSIKSGDVVNAIGHLTTDVLVRNILNVDDLPEGLRLNVKLDSVVDELIVAQYKGPRLEEGTTELPEDATIEFWNVYFD